MKTALEDISAGSFTTVIKRIQQNQLELNANSALKLLICCTTVCNKNQHNIPIEDVCLLVRTCSSRIDELIEARITEYLQSVFHILKYLLKKDLSVLLQLEDALPPKFLHSNLSKNQLQLCGWLSSLIFNSVLAEVKQKNSVEDSTVAASLISLKFLTKTGSAPQFLERLCTFLKMFTIPTATFRSVSDFLEKSISILKEALFKDCKETDVVFRQFLYLICLFVKGFSAVFTSEELQTLVDIVLTTGREFCDTEEHFMLLNIIKVISTFISNVATVTDLQSSYSNLKSTIQHFGLTENIFAVCQTIAAIFNRWCRNYEKNVDKELWSKNFTVKLQLVLYKLLKKAAVIVGKKKIQCTCSKDCIIGTDMNASLNLLYAVEYMFRLSLLKDLKSEELLREALSCLEMSCTQIVALKDVDCLNWQSSWLQTGSIFYNICVVLYNLNDSEVLPFFHLFIRHLIALEGTSGSVIKNNALDTLLLNYIQMCSKMKDYAKVMKMAAFYIFLNPKSCDVAFNHWRNAKATIDDDRNITVVDMLQTAAVDIKMLLPDFKLTTHTVEELLTVELENYKARRPCEKSMLSAFSKLYKCTSTAKAARIFVKIWANYTYAVAEELTDILSKLIEDYEKTMDNSDFESNLVLACLYFCLYKFRTHSVISKNTLELEKYVAENESRRKRPLPFYETPLDPNDESDDVSLCQNLTCEDQMKTKQFLDRCLEIFEQTYGDFCKEHIEFLKFFEICDILIYIGCEYQLRCYSEDCQRLWIVVLNIAEKMGDDLLLLKAVTALMAFADLKTSDYYVELTKKILDGSENSARKWEVLTDYYLTLSEKLLEAQNPHIAFKCFQTAQQFYQNHISFGEDKFLKAKLLHVHFKFVLLPCNLEILDHRNDTVIKIHTALKVIIDYYNGSGRKQPNVISLLFDITYTIGSWYRWMLLPRELRCYTRDMAVLARKLASPLWAARFLVLLAHSDLLSSRIDDCRTKLLRVSTILCISDHQRVPLVNMVKEKGEGDWGTMNVLCNDIEELSLDLPSKKRVPACDIPLKTTFKFPAFLGHSNDCNKFCCQYLNYQELAVMQAHLEALVSTYTNESSCDIQEYFEGALHLVETFEKRTKKPDHFWEIHSTILLDYGNLYLASDQRKSAEKINSELLALVSRKKLSNVYLYQAAVMQKTDIFWEFTPTNEFVVKSDEEDDEVAETTGSPPKTPVMKQSKVQIERNLSPSPLPLPQVYAKKKLHFGLSVETVNTPELAVPTIKIYPAEAETARKKRPPTTTKAKTSTKNMLVMESTPCDSAKIEKLRSKTKLLTERIKKDVKEVGVGTRARKNLLGELAASSEENNTTKKEATTKKSSRNKKI